MAFATTADVVARLGRNLTAAESTMATAVIVSVTGEIVDVVDRDADWAEDLDDADVPPVIRALVVEKVIQVGTNPNGLVSESERLGVASRTRTFQGGQNGSGGGSFLSDREIRLVSRTFYGTNSGTSHPRGVMDRLTDIAEGRDVDEEA